MIFAETSTLGLRIYSAERRVKRAEVCRSRNAARASAHQSIGRWIVRSGIRGLPRTARKDGHSRSSNPGRGQSRLPENQSMKYYLTTPIYYVNAAPHLGTAYSTFVADLIKRFKRMEGFDPVVLTTGSDEHSRNVERAAKAAGMNPRSVHHQDGRRVHRASGKSSASISTISFAPPIRSITKPCAICSSAARRTAISTKAPTPANIASTTSSM